MKTEDHLGGTGSDRRIVLKRSLDAKSVKGLLCFTRSL
jgi:hypothetical protein